MIYAVVVFVPEPDVEAIEGKIDGLFATNDLYWDDFQTRAMAEYHKVREEMATWGEDHNGQYLSNWTLTHIHTGPCDLSQKYWPYDNYWLTAYFPSAGEAARFKLVNAHRLVEQ